MLPNIPGAVDNFEGGRTYPLEGAAMSLPQHAPYTDPLEILICGGSVSFQDTDIVVYFKHLLTDLLLLDSIRWYGLRQLCYHRS
jgi:hypothetical protein